MRPVHDMVATTPVAELPHLSAAIGGAHLWIKRDELTNAVYGGNKPRKLAWILADARARDRRTLMTFGALGTHHGLATTVHAARLGLRTILILVPQPITPHVQHMIRLHHTCGAELHLARSLAHAAIIAARRLALGILRGERIGIVPIGGSSILGTIGFIDAALELAEQVDAGAIPEPDAVFVALGSGGTAAGLTAGLRLAGLRTRVIGVGVTDLGPQSAHQIVRRGRQALRHLHRRDARIPIVTLDARDVTIVMDHLGDGYGAPTAAGTEASRLAAEHEGLTLDPTYTGKCLAAMLDAARDPTWRGKHLLFWNTFFPGDPSPLPRELAGPDEVPPAFRRYVDDPS